MFKHEKELFHPVAIERPNPQYAALLQEQLGGGNGELKAAMQYMAQSFRVKDPEIKDLFLDIAAEELSHPRAHRRAMSSAIAPLSGPATRRWRMNCWPCPKTTLPSAWQQASTSAWAP